MALETSNFDFRNDPVQAILRAVDSLEYRLIKFCQNLVRIPSLPGQEQDAQAFVAAKLQTLGLAVDIVQSNFEELKDHPAFCDDGVPFRNRINVVGRWPGIATKQNNGNDESQGKRSLILNGHIDVVPVGNENFWDESPWSGSIRNGKLYGRGSCDMKCGLAAGIFALEALQTLGFSPARDVLIESVIGEESGGVGTLTAIVKGYRADAAIIMEPTELNICPVQAGALTFRIKVPGHSIHASMRRSGVSAIEKFYPILRAVNELEQRRHREYRNPLYDDPLGVAPINCGVIKGGDWHSTVPNEVIVEGRCGVLPGESNEEARAALSDALKAVAVTDPWLKDNPPALEWFEGQFESGETNVADPIIRDLTESHHCVLSHDAQLRGVPYGSDLRLFTNHGKMPAVLYGPGSVRNAHTINEFIPLDEVITCAKVLALTIHNSCGNRETL